jgi:hypothetical protein
MYKKIHLPQEVDAASGLLRTWGILRDGEHLPAIAADEVLRRYDKDRIYQFGKNLFEHLAVAATMQNQWTFQGPTSMIGAMSELEQFLYKTTTVSQRMDAKVVREKFTEIAERIKREYGVEIGYKSELMPLQNISEAERIEAKLWVESEAKKRRA